MRRLGRRVLLALAGLLLGLLALEGLVRLRQWMKYGTTLPTFYHVIEDPVSGLRIPKPLESIGPVQVNSLGFRGAEIEVPKPPERIRVAFLGGSTTFCAEATRLEVTWPHQVVEGLRQGAPDLEFDYVNGGGAGYGTKQLLLNLEKRVARLEPDVIVVYEATNDLTQDTRREAIDQELYEKEEIHDSAIGRWWLTYFLVEKNWRSYFRTRPNERVKLQLDPEQLSGGFRERLTRLVEDSQRVAPVVLLVTFSIKIRPEQSAEEQRENASSALFYMPFLEVEQLRAGYAEYNRVIREVARSSGVILVEGELSIPGDGHHFADSVHFLDPGMRLQARRILEELARSGAYHALLERKRALVKQRGRGPRLTPRNVPRVLPPGRRGTPPAPADASARARLPGRSCARCPRSS